MGLFDFKGQPKNFDKQYAAIYFTRLRALKQTVLDAAARELAGRMQNGGEAAPKMCGRVLDIVPDRLCVIAGTIYKEMKLKPCIIEEYNKTAAAADATTQAGSVYTSPDDTLVLEDEFGRVGLIGSPDKLDVRELVSGVVVAVLGREAPGGKFEVEQLFIPDLAPQKSMPAMIAAASSSAAAAAASSSSSSSPSPPPAYLLCVSGLSFGAPGQDPTPIQLLMDYVTGLLGSSADQQSSARIVRVLFCGNSLHRFEKKKGKDFAREEIDPAVVGVPLRELDVLLTQLASAVPVDILPGEQDPSNFTLPQQPFHRCLFPSASTYSTFSSTTNPTWMEVNGLQSVCFARCHTVARTRGKEDDPACVAVNRIYVFFFSFFFSSSFSVVLSFFSLLLILLRFLPPFVLFAARRVLATAGQNVNDLAKYCEHAATLDYLERTLRWRNVAPTAPDTLGQLRGEGCAVRCGGGGGGKERRSCAPVLLVYTLLFVLTLFPFFFFVFLLLFFYFSSLFLFFFLSLSLSSPAAQAASPIKRKIPSC